MDTKGQILNPTHCTMFFFFKEILHVQVKRFWAVAKLVKYIFYSYILAFKQLRGPTMCWQKLESRVAFSS